MFLGLQIAHEQYNKIQLSWYFANFWSYKSFPFFPIVFQFKNCHYEALFLQQEKEEKFYLTAWFIIFKHVDHLYSSPDPQYFKLRQHSNSGLIIPSTTSPFPSHLCLVIQTTILYRPTPHSPSSKVSHPNRKKESTFYSLYILWDWALWALLKFMSTLSRTITVVKGIGCY